MLLNRKMKIKNYTFFLNLIHINLYFLLLVLASYSKINFCCNVEYHIFNLVIFIFQMHQYSIGRNVVAIAFPEMAINTK